jgi:hypothetical protein
VKDDEVLDKLVDQVLELDLIPLLGDRHQGRAEADGKVVGIHHVLVTGNWIKSFTLKNIMTNFNIALFGEIKYFKT